MKVDLSKFTPFTLEHGGTLIPFLREHPSESSHYNFASLYCWQDHYHSLWRIIDDRLLIINNITDTLLMPLGPPLDPDLFISISAQLRAQKRSGKIGLVPPGFVDKHKEIPASFRLLRDDDNADYIYSTRKLIELKGGRLIKKRNLINQFTHEHPDYHCRELNPREWMICQRLSEEWSRKQLKVPLDQSPEHKALCRAFSSCGELGLRGFGLFLGEKLEAFSIWSRQSDSMATILFEKFNPSIKGASQMINRETALQVSSWALWINREQDLGIPGLRRAKRSYDPERLLWGYTAVPLFPQ